MQIDGSQHPWLGHQVPPFKLLLAVDDATGTVVEALFCEKEDSHKYFLLIQGLPQHLGLPLALHTDRHGVFRHTSGSGLPAGPTRFSRAMDELGIQMIFALSPQAKGRVERAAATFQDRLVAELRLSGASSIGEPTACWSSSCRGTTVGFGCRRTVLNLHFVPSTQRCAWNRSCVSSTAGR